MKLHPFLLCALLIAASFTQALDAHAQSSAGSSSSDPATVETPAPPVAGTRWYGWQTLAVDGAALAAMVTGTTIRSDALVGTGIGAYVLGPPLVHGAHGHGDVAAGDGAIRLLAPVVFGAVGYAIDYAATSCPPPKQGEWLDLCFRGLGGAVLGVLTGYATAVALDAALLAREPVRAHADDRASLGVRWAPSVSLTPSGGSAGVSGTF